ncbi:MAG: 1-acyl-sn-glycerol-3-phosphate acyltransferase [Rubrobacteraceae bacterium]
MDALTEISAEPDASRDLEKTEVLRGICAGELLGAFGMGGVKRGRRVLDGAAGLAVGHLARRAAEYDRIVGEGGLGAGGAWAMERMAREVEVEGVDALPREGPLLIASNHPGISDTVALFSAIPREDLRVVAAKRPFLEALPNTSRHLFTVDEASEYRLGLVREAARHMRGGGALLTFPGGGIEPDPAFMPGASESLAGWSESLDLFARLVPNLALAPVIVSGVFSRRALKNPLIFLRSREQDRRWLAATIQTLAPKLHATTVKVRFGRPVRKPEEHGVSDAVLQEARRLIRRC